MKNINIETSVGLTVSHGFGEVQMKIFFEVIFRESMHDVRVSLTHTYQL